MHTCGASSCRTQHTGSVSQPCHTRKHYQNSTLRHNKAESARALRCNTRAHESKLSKWATLAGGYNVQLTCCSHSIRHLPKRILVSIPMTTRQNPSRQPSCDSFRLFFLDCSFCFSPCTANARSTNTLHTWAAMPAAATHAAVAVYCYHNCYS